MFDYQGSPEFVEQSVREGWDFLVHRNIEILQFVLDQVTISGIEHFKKTPMMGYYT